MNTTDIIPLTSDPTPEYYEKQAATLADASRSVHNDLARHIRTYHPEPFRITHLNRPETNFGLDDARAVVAREHGFVDWPAMLAHMAGLQEAGSPVAQFEQAADAVVEGDIGVLKQLLQTNPGLVHARSTRGHRATLLHYVAANGVENFRQKTPANALEIAELLLANGARPDALADTYDSQWGTALELLVSSAHPAKAGLQTPLAEKLLDYGAAIDGVRNDSGPLVTAIYFHYPESAEVLVERGARVDNVVTAGAMGKTTQVEDYLDGSCKLVPGAPLVHVDWLKVAPTPDANLSLAFVWAAMLNRIDTVRFLLEKGVSPASKDHRDWTALHWAGNFGYAEMVDLLLSYKAPLEARNEFGGTVLDQTLWATAHEEMRPAHLTIVARLVDAGARIHTWWLLEDLHPPLKEDVAKILRDRM